MRYRNTLIVPLLKSSRIDADIRSSTKVGVLKQLGKLLPESSFFFALLAPLEVAEDRLRVLACASRLFKDPAFQRRLLECSSSPEIYEAVFEAEKE